MNSTKFATLCILEVHLKLYVLDRVFLGVFGLVLKFEPFLFLSLDLFWVRRALDLHVHKAHIFMVYFSGMKVFWKVWFGDLVD